MVRDYTKFDEVNVLASAADWAWPQAVRSIFEPRGINFLVARRPAEFVDVIRQKRIHATIVDMDCEESNGLTTIKIIRMSYPRLPCILLTGQAEEKMLGKALELDVFSVIDKPVDMSVLLEQLDRMFTKKYRNCIFSR